MEWVIGILAVIVLVYEHNKTPPPVNTLTAQPGTTVTSVGPTITGNIIPDYSQTPGSVHAAAAQNQTTSDPGSTLPTDNYYAQTVGLTSQYQNTGEPTAIPDVLAMGIIGAIPGVGGVLVSTVKAGSLASSGGSNQVVLPDGTIGIKNPDGTITTPGGIINPDGTVTPGPTDPALDPNYDPASLAWDQQIAVSALANNETGSNGVPGI